MRLYVRNCLLGVGLVIATRGLSGPGLTGAEPAVVNPVLVKPSVPTALSTPFGQASDGS